MNYVVTPDGVVHSTKFVKNCENFFESYADYAKDLGSSEDK